MLCGLDLCTRNSQSPRTDDATLAQPRNTEPNRTEQDEMPEEKKRHDANEVKTKEKK
jgi:hypothetical protein